METPERAGAEHRQELDAQVAREVMGWEVGVWTGSHGELLVIYDPTGRRLLGGTWMRVRPSASGTDGHPDAEPGGPEAPVDVLAAVCPAYSRRLEDA